MKLELGGIFIKNIRPDDKTYVKDGVFCVSKEEAEKSVLEDNKLANCHVNIAKPGESVRITPAKDVIESRVRVSGREIFPGVIGKASPRVGTGRTYALEGCRVVTVGKVIEFQKGVIGMSGPAAGYCSLSQTYNLYVIVEPADGLETRAYEKAARMTGLKVATYIGEAAEELEPDEIVTHETKPISEQAAMCPSLSKVGYIHMLQSQGLLHDTYYYDVDARQSIPIFMYSTEIMDGAIVSDNCVASCDRVTTYHHFHGPIVKDCYKYHGKDVNFMGVVLANENIFLVDKGRHSNMVARLYNWMGLDGVLITEEEYGNPDTDLIMNCRKVEHVGTKVALVTNEFSDENGKSQPLADMCEEADALAPCGQGNVTLQFPAMDKVIRTRDFIEIQISGRDDYKSPDGGFKAKLQIIVTSTIADGFNKLATEGHQLEIEEMEKWLNIE